MKNIDIYIVIINIPRIYSNETTGRFNFELYLGDTKTKINIIDNDIKMKAYIPITNEELLLNKDIIFLIKMINFIKIYVLLQI